MVKKQNNYVLEEKVRRAKGQRVKEDVGTGMYYYAQELDEIVLHDTTANTLVSHFCTTQAWGVTEEKLTNTKNLVKLGNYQK